MTLKTIQSAIAAIKSAPRSTNGGVLWIADPTLMVKVAAAIIGSGNMHAAMEEITSATGVTGPTMRLFIRGKDAQHRPCKVILDGLKAAGLRPVAYTKRPNRASYSKKYTTISAASPAAAPPAAAPPTSKEEKQRARWRGEGATMRIQQLQNALESVNKTREAFYESWLDVCDKVKAVGDTCSDYSHSSSDFEKFNNANNDVIKSMENYNKSHDNHKKALEDFEVFRTRHWPLIPKISV